MLRERRREKWQFQSHHLWFCGRDSRSRGLGAPQPHRITITLTPKPKPKLKPRKYWNSWSVESLSFWDSSLPPTIPAQGVYTKAFNFHPHVMGIFRFWLLYIVLQLCMWMSYLTVPYLTFEWSNKLFHSIACKIDLKIHNIVFQGEKFLPFALWKQLNCWCGYV